MSEGGSRPLDRLGRDEARVGGNGLVGREEALAIARAGIEGGGGVMVVGGAGVGKTALLTTLLDSEARRPATKVVRLVTVAAGPAIPFGAFAPHVPEIRGLPGARPDPFYLLQSVRRSVVASAGGDRLVIGADDAHRLDEASATLLFQLVSTGQALAVISVLAGEPLPEPIRSLWKESLVERVDLTTLDVAGLVALAERLAGGPVDGDLSEALARASDGNPLFARELILAGLEDGRIVDKHGVWSLDGTLPIGPRLTELLDERLRGVDAELIGALEVVALGDPLPVNVLHRVVPATHTDALQRLGLLVVDDVAESDPFARPGHPLYGELVRARITASRAIELRLMLAEAFEAAGRAETDLLRIVTWKLDGGASPPAETLLAAGLRAAERLDWKLSARLASASVELHPEPGAAFALAEALGHLGRFHEALSVLEGHEGADEDERARLAVLRSSVLFWGLGRFEEAAATLAEAEQRLSTPRDRAWVGAVRAGMLTALGRPAEGVDAARAIVASRSLAERAADAARSALAMGLVWSGRTEEGLALAFDAAPDPGMVESVLPADRWRTAVKLAGYRLTGQVGDMEEFATDEYRLAVQLHDRDGKAAAAAGLGWAALMRGHLTLAAMRLREALGSLEGPDASAGRGQALMTLAEAVALSGDSLAAGGVLAEARQEMFAAPDWAAPRLHWCAAWAAASRSELSLAIAQFETAAEQAAKSGQTSFEVLALAAQTRLGSPNAAGRLSELECWVEGPLARIVAGHARAIAGDSPEDLESVCDAYEDLGLALYAAEVAAQASRAYAARAQPRLATAAALRSQTLLAGRDSPRPLTVTLASAPASLTRREREVALLARSGLSSHAIASRLHLSVRTVDTHLARVYYKLGITRRGDLAGALDGEAESAGS